MKRYVTVSVVDPTGRPMHHARVSVEVHQTLAGGLKQGYTDSSGQVQFELDVDTFAEATIYVDGSVRIRRSAIQGGYVVQL